MNCPEERLAAIKLLACGYHTRLAREFELMGKEREDWDIRSPVSNPDKRHGCTKLDFDAIDTRVCCQFPIWAKIFVRCLLMLRVVRLFDL
ncbi:hypothetical protein STEG23_010641, partial [Scotinomys teguina]